MHYGVEQSLCRHLRSLPHQRALWMNGCFGNTTGWFYSSAVGSIKAESALWTLRGLADGHFCRSLSLIRMRGGAGIMLFTEESHSSFRNLSHSFTERIIYSGGHKTRGWTMFWHTHMTSIYFKILKVGYKTNMQQQ